jgi:hypothetical protein
MVVVGVPARAQNVARFYREEWLPPGSREETEEGSPSYVHLVHETTGGRVAIWIWSDPRGFTRDFRKWAASEDGPVFPPQYLLGGDPAETMVEIVVRWFE